MTIALSDFELGWLVGILEGEGFFEYSCSQKIQVRMTDEDTIDTICRLFAKITGQEPSMREYDPKPIKHQRQYTVTIYGDNARMVMRAILPHMHYRRRARIWQALNKYEAPKPKPIGSLNDLIENILAKKPLGQEHARLISLAAASERASGTNPGRDPSGRREPHPDDRGHGIDPFEPDFNDPSIGDPA